MDGGRLVIASDGYGISQIDLATGALTGVFGAGGANGLATADDCVVWAEVTGIYSIHD